MRTLEELNQELERLKDERQQLEDGENEEEYLNILNEKEILIGGSLYGEGNLIKELDETAFYCGLSDYNDARLTDLEEEISNLEDEIQDF